MSVAVLKPLEPRERVFFVGTNGGGKTVLMREFYNLEPRYVVFDPKGDFPENGEKIVTTPNDFTWRRFPDGILGTGFLAVPRIIYRPDPKYQPTMDLRLRWLFYKARQLKLAAVKKAHDKKAISPHAFRIGLDEGLFQSKNGKTWIQRIAITGRSLDLGFDLNSQRPSGIPVEIRSEAWRVYAFFLGDTDDEKVVLRYARNSIVQEDLQNLEDYAFIEIKRTPGGRREARKYPPVRLTAPAS